jgi:UDP-N-acetyl-D-glucosamine dehydrogenase
VESLNQRRKSLNGSRILVLGIAYKKNVDDMRESPSVEMISLLSDGGAQVDYSDPHVPVFPRMRNYSFDLKSVNLTKDLVASYDIVLLATDHDVFDYEMLKEHSQILVDTRGRFRESAANIIRA